MDIKKRTLTTIEEKCLKHDLVDIQNWVDLAIDGKVSNCRKRMIKLMLQKEYITLKMQALNTR